MTTKTINIEHTVKFNRDHCDPKCSGYQKILGQWGCYNCTIFDSDLMVRSGRAGMYPYNERIAVHRCATCIEKAGL